MKIRRTQAVLPARLPTPARPEPVPIPAEVPGLVLPGGTVLSPAEVTGVAKVEYDVEARTLKVTHKVGSNPSPRALWEAVEKGGKDPSRIEGPGGTFTKKPAG